MFICCTVVYIVQSINFYVHLTINYDCTVKCTYNLPSLYPAHADERLLSFVCLYYKLNLQLTYTVHCTCSLPVQYTVSVVYLYSTLYLQLKCAMYIAPATCLYSTQQFTCTVH